MDKIDPEIQKFVDRLSDLDPELRMLVKKMIKEKNPGVLKLLDEFVQENIDKEAAKEFARWYLVTMPKIGLVIFIAFIIFFLFAISSSGSTFKLAIKTTVLLFLSTLILLGLWHCHKYFKMFKKPERTHHQKELKRPHYSETRTFLSDNSRSK